MTIISFLNDHDSDCLLTFEPGGMEKAVPSRASVGIRVRDESLNRRIVTASLPKNHCSIWLESSSQFEVEIVEQTLGEALHQEFCVTYGWCGSSGRTLDDELPASGEVTAEECVTLLLAAEDTKPNECRHFEDLLTAFRSIFGESAAVGDIRAVRKLPFEH